LDPTGSKSYSPISAILFARYRRCFAIAPLLKLGNIEGTKLFPCMESGHPYQFCCESSNVEQCCSNKGYFYVPSGTLVLRSFQVSQYLTSLFPSTVSPQISATSASTSTSSLPTSGAAANNQSSSISLAVGLGVGINFGVTLFALLVLLIRELRRRNRSEHESQNQLKNGPDPITHPTGLLDNAAELGTRGASHKLHELSH